MRNIIVLLVLVNITISFGQNYSPFNFNNPKRFVNPLNLSDNDYYFYPTESVINGDTILFKQYLTKSSETIDVSGTSCSGWGGFIEPTADTSWLGRRIAFKTTNKKLILTNFLNDTLTFDFNLSLGDSSIFYQSVNENYYLKFESLNQELVIDSLDWVKTFTIRKFDDLDNLISSPLNGFEIKLSENLGLTSFINCNDFPLVEKDLTLVGQLNPTIGYYQLTYDETFPWNTGDTIELYGTNSYMGVGSISHKLITIQSRTETVDSVWIFINVNEQINQFPIGAPSYPSVYNINYPNPIVYRKRENISDKPNNMTDYYGSTFTSDTIDNCGLRGTYHAEGSFTYYCDSCNCFIPYDGFGQSIISETFIKGLGKTQSSIIAYGPIFNSPFMNAQLIYSNIGGVQCGTYAPLGVDEWQLNVAVTPNPTSDALVISSDFELISLEVISGNGTSLIFERENGFYSEINVSKLNNGIYFLRLVGTNGQEKLVKFVKI